MVNKRREDRRSFFGPYGDPANWQTAQAATTKPAAPVTAAARQYPFVGDKRADAASVAAATVTQPLPTMVNAARPKREYPFVGAKRAEAGELGLPSGPSVELPPRQQPDPKRTYPFVGEKRPEGWVPDTWKAPPQETPPPTQGRGLMDTKTEAPLDWANNPNAMPPSRPQAATTPAQGRGLMDTNMEKQRTFAPQAAQPLQIGTPGQPDSGSINPQLSQRDEQIRANMGQIDNILASGKQFDGRTMAKIQQMKQQAGFLRGGTDRVPVGPDGLPLRQPQQTTQQRLAGMDPNQNTRTTSDGYTFEGAAGDAGRFFAPTGKGDPANERANQQQRVQFLNRQGFQKVDPNALPENIGWQERKAYKLAQMGNQADLERARMIEATGRERNQIDKMNVEDQMAGRALENQARQFTLNEQQQIDVLRQRAQAPGVTPEEMKQINNALRLYGQGGKESGVKTFSNTTETIGGGKVEKNYFYDPDGSNVREAIPQGQQQQGLPMPTDKKQLIKGEVYATPRGPATWNGKTYIPVPAM